MNNLALTYLDQGRYDEAESVLKQVMETRMRLFGQSGVELQLRVMEMNARESDPFTLTIMNNLAATYRDRSSGS